MKPSVHVEFRGKEVMEAEQALVRISTRKVKAKLMYALAKNLRIIREEAEDLRVSATPPNNAAHKEYEGKRVSLNKKYGLKDPKGRHIINRGEYEIGDQDAFDTELHVLREEYPEVARELDELQDEVNELNRKKIKLELYAIPFKLIPEDIEPFLFGPMVEAIVGIPDDDEGDEPPPGGDDGPKAVPDEKSKEG